MDGQQPQVVVPGQGWIDLASRVIVTVGFPVVVAGILLWFVLGQFTNDLHRIALGMDQQLSEAKEHTAALREQTVLLKEFIAEQKQR
jgi:hypothetical protein